MSNIKTQKLGSSQILVKYLVQIFAYFHCRMVQLCPQVAGSAEQRQWSVGLPGH